MGKDAGKLYAMKVLKKASLKGEVLVMLCLLAIIPLFTIKCIYPLNNNYLITVYWHGRVDQSQLQRLYPKH